MADTGVPAGRHGAAARGAELEGQDLPLNYVAPDESDILRDDVDQMVRDALAGKIELTKYSSVEEYRRYVEKMLDE